MKKLNIIVIVALVIAVGGYFVFSSTQTNKQKNQTEISTTSSNEVGRLESVELAEFEACEMAVEFLEADVDCLENEVLYQGKKAAIVYLEGGKVENAVVLLDGTVVAIQTNLYFSPSNAVKTYVKDSAGFELSDDDIEGAIAELRMSKRGYLYGLTFDGDYKGSIYITPEGNLSGRLTK
tara:strand:+ start:121518 stop:122054 length:537 start_codon:yes stop_codon:yes gene_type:complete